jgi:signal transduction histidine kinase
MNSRKTIRQKLLLSVLVLSAVICVLSYGAFRGVYAYRDLTIIVSERAPEFQATTELTGAVDDLRYSFQSWRDEETIDASPLVLQLRPWDRTSFRMKIQRVRAILSRYRSLLDNAVHSNQGLSDRTHERLAVREIDRQLDSIVRSYDRSEWTSLKLADAFQDDLDEVSRLTHELPTYLQERMLSLRDEVRTRYRTWIAMAWTSAALVFVLLTGLCIYIRMAVILPFKNLLLGSRRVAAGEFDYRIEIDSQDELRELANAINTGTENFLRIRRDLNDQVRQRSQEVIRNEQLASVGFLAAGVAHEINNPLASIAWSAEALESRLHRILHPVLEASGASPDIPDLDLLKNYLRRIQEEAFRCKGITERLLDFSRMGQAQKKESISVGETVADVIDMVRHLSPYRQRKIEFRSEGDVQAWASPQELKQVVLNLLTNSLDAIADDQADGLVSIRLEQDCDLAHLTILDNGCGMTDEVRQHLFEPFFTRRRDGRGTGLGLPITSRIIADHGGRILVHSEGPGKGSRFEVLIPCQASETSEERTYETRTNQAA